MATPTTPLSAGAGIEQRDIEIDEPDVSPLQIQRPRSAGVIEALFDRAVRLDPFALVRTESDGIPVVVSRTGSGGGARADALPALAAHVESRRRRWSP